MSTSLARLPRTGARLRLSSSILVEKAKRIVLSQELARLNGEIMRHSDDGCGVILQLGKRLSDYRRIDDRSGPPRVAGNATTVYGPSPNRRMSNRGVKFARGTFKANCDAATFLET